MDTQEMEKTIIEHGKRIDDLAGEIRLIKPFLTKYGSVLAGVGIIVSQILSVLASRIEAPSQPPQQLILSQPAQEAKSAERDRQLIKEAAEEFRKELLAQKNVQPE